MLVTALLTIAKLWNQPKYQSTNELIKDIYIYIYIYPNELIKDIYIYIYI
jgi:hypothetical protein